MHIFTTQGLIKTLKLATATFLIGLLLGVSTAHSATTYPPSSLIQVNDITTAMIKDGDVAPADFNASTTPTWEAITLASTTANTTINGPLYVGASGIIFQDASSMTTAGLPYLYYTAPVGTDVSTGTPVAIYEGTETTSYGSTAQDAIGVFNATTRCEAQGFTAQDDTIIYFDVYTNKVNSPTALIATLYANDGSDQPTGSALASSSVAAASITAGGSTRFTVNWSVTPNTDYVVVFTATGVNGSNNIYVNGGVNNISDHTSLVSTDSCATWSQFNQAGDDLGISFLFGYKDAGSVTPTDRDGTDAQVSDYVGIATESASAGETVPVAVFGLVSVFTGLDVGEFYYFTGTPGQLSTTSTTTTSKVGFAVSSTTMLISKQW